MSGEKVGLAGNINVPMRQASTSSARSDDAVPTGDPSDTSSLLAERLQAWKHACGYLEDYIGATIKLQAAHAKEYEKVLKTISNPLKEGHHFDQSLGGIAGMFENMRINTQVSSLFLYTLAARKRQLVVSPPIKQSNCLRTFWQHK